jgi:uncharacterized membrane protein YedE/YeeE
MKNAIYVFSGFIFAWGLLLSGMADPDKVKNFLALGASQWSPALFFVLVPAALTYLLAFFVLRSRGRTLNGATFAHPKPRPTDKKLVVGSVIFGVGWGLAGVCPGPAIVHVAFLDAGFATFLAAMVAGFELQRRFA